MTNRFLCVSAAAILIAATVSAAPPTIEYVSPLIGQRGTEFTIVVKGGRLTEVTEVLFHGTGLTCTQAKGVSDTETRLTLKAAKDCPAGPHALRVAGPGGVSGLVIVGVTPFPVVAEKDGNNDTPTSAQPVPMQCTVAGSIDAADVDCFSVDLKAGDRLSAEVEAVRLGSKLDAHLTIHGPDGKEIATADDSPPFRQDPTLSIVAKASGRHVIAIRESSRRGDGDFYALHIGSFPRPLAVYPAGGPIDVETAVQHIGESKTTLKPSDVAFEYFPEDAKGRAPTPHPFRVSKFPNVLESEPNDEPSAAGKPVDWPVAFNGILSRTGDVDHFAFRAKAGDSLNVEAFAFRIGTPADTVVSILDAKGEMLVANDDDETSDSRFFFRVPSDGVYTLRVADKRKQGGPLFVYRVEITKEVPTLAVFLPTANRKSQERSTLSIPRGNRIAAYIGVRRDGFEGPVKIESKDLPEGVTLTAPVVIPAGEYMVPVVFEASAKAPLGSKLVSWSGSAKEVHGGFRQTVTTFAGPGDLMVNEIHVDRLAVAVVEEAPFRIEAGIPKVSLAQDGSLEITLKVNRQAGFDAPVEVSFPALPPGVECPATLTIPGDKSEAVMTLTAQRGADIGSWPFYVEAKAAAAPAPKVEGERPAGGRRPRRAPAGVPPVSSAVHALKVVAPPVVGSLAPAVAELGKGTAVKLALQAPLPEGEFTATLAGLPPRAVAKPVAVSKQAMEIVFEVAVDATTPPGRHDGLVCELAGIVEGRQVVLRVGRGGTLSVFPVGGIATGPDGKPLSRLDVLRMEKDAKKAKP